MKKIPAEIQENLQFLCVEIDAQLEMLIDYFSAPSPAKARHIRNRSGYAYNLKNRVHSGTINRLAKGIKRDEDKFLLRCIEFIATDVEKIADISRQILLQSEQLGKTDLINAKTFISMLSKVRQALKLVMPAFSSRKSEHALDIEKINQQFRRQHQRLMKKMTATIKDKQESSQSLQALFIAYEMRQFDAAMLRISETLISANLGQPLNFERFQSLQSLIGVDENMAVTPIAETRSGSSIAGLSNGPDKNDFMAVYKDGQKQKLKEERQGLESWQHIYPGLAPKILSYQKQGDSAALLIEHLPGHTFEKIIVRESAELQQEALKQLKKTLNSLWTETKTNKAKPANFIQQLQKRMDDVYQIHPEFDRGNSKIGSLKIASLDDLLEQAAAIEKRLKPPFSVYIHGDFNVDNIIYDPVDKSINFIDLHRSCYTDYVQDVAIFMVSNYRLRILDAQRRKQILAVAIEMYKFASRFAAKQQDHSFDLSLALGLARAFATSTRFILDKTLAKRMFYRARYLIELVLLWDKNNAEPFKIPLKELFVE